jgi:hypothetical protein
MTLQIKTSRAKQLWLTVFIVVLTLMYFETRGHRVHDFNLLVHANSEAEGAKVSVDGQERGALAVSGEGDLVGTHFRDRLAPGSHVIEVQKPGFASFRRTISMGSEAFIDVALSAKDKQSAQSDKSKQSTD